MYRFQNVSRRPRERFNFPADSWVESLPCVPCITQRGSHPTYFAELRMFVGPQEIAVTGDNSFETLFGRVWAILFCDDDTWHTLQWVGTDDLDPATGITSRGWRELADPLLSLPPLTAGVQQRWSAAFDQNARLIVAYETNGTIDVTRWDATLGAYLQNVTFAGRDPQLLIDAALTDPRAYPNAADDGWSAREAFEAGIPVLFEWLPDGSWRETAIPVSDVLMFYLSVDRTRVMARVQRELYSVEHELHDFGEPIVLDHAVALLGRYELLISTSAGAKRSLMLVSDPYLGGFIISPRPVESVMVSVEAGVAEHGRRMFAGAPVHALGVTPAPGVSDSRERIVPAPAFEAPISVLASPGVSRTVSNTLTRTQEEGIMITVAPGTNASRFTTLPHAARTEAASVSVGPGVSASRAIA